MFDDHDDPLSRLGKGGDSLFTIHGDLDGEQEVEFVEREQYIGLMIGDEEFMMPISHVKEIIMLPPITYVPNAPEFIDGVINLRGLILPAINLRKMMGLDRTEPTISSRIIVVREEENLHAILVDGITYVVSLLPDEIEHQSLPGKGPGADFISAVAKQSRKVHGIVDVSRILRLVQVGSEEEQAA